MNETNTNEKAKSFSAKAIIFWVIVIACTGFIGAFALLIYVANKRHAERCEADPKYRELAVRRKRNRRRFDSEPTANERDNCGVFANDILQRSGTTMDFEL